MKDKLERVDTNIVNDRTTTATCGVVEAVTVMMKVPVVARDAREHARVGVQRQSGRRIPLPVKVYAPAGLGVKV